MKLRTKILVFALPLALLSASVILFLTQKAVRAIMARELAERVLLKSPASARNAREAFQSGKESRLLPLLQDTVARVAGEQAGAVAPGGRVLAHTNVAEKGRIYRAPDADEMLNSPAPVYRRMPGKNFPILRVSIPVWAGPEQTAEDYLLSGGKETGQKIRLGTLLIDISMEEAQKTEWLILRRVGWITFSILGGALLLAFVFLRHILKPIRLLVEGTLHVRAGHYATVPVLTKDELGELTSSFNEMSRVLQERTLELARSNEELKQFAHLASHDLQEPLRTVSSYIQMLRQRWDSRLDAEEKEFIGYVVDGTKRMRELIDALLAYARIGSSGRAFERTDCSDLLRNALQNLKVAVEESKVQIDFETLPTLFVDPIQVTELFQNLIANAIKFRGTGPLRIRISAQREGGPWVFRVSDNGIGIDPQQFDRIFQAFQRLHSQDEYPGTGMGLTVCKKIVERHGGRIWVESEPGKGSTFCFTLEKEEEPPPVLN